MSKKVVVELLKDYSVSVVVTDDGYGKTFNVNKEKGFDEIVEIIYNTYKDNNATRLIIKPENLGTLFIDEIKSMVYDMGYIYDEKEGTVTEEFEYYKNIK